MDILFLWVEVLVRWLHVVAGIAWIGSSFYFIALDYSLNDKNKLPPNAHGEAWQVHGGGFYQIVKYLVAPKNLPDQLTWFKWEAYTTWISGFFLLILVYYAHSQLYLIDTFKLDINEFQAICLSLAGIIIGWLIYDFICRSKIGENTVALCTVVYFFIVICAYFYSEIFSGRGAFTQIGVMMGTIMVANVAMIIIPGQKQVVNELLKGNKPNPIHGMRAKQRSLHNNYLTLPVIFVMLAGHYPMVFATKYSWLILAIVIIIGALIRHFFNSRHAKKKTPWWTWAVATLMVFFIIYLSNIGKPNISDDEKLVSLQTNINHEVLLNAADVVEVHCAMCHAENPSWERMSRPPKGLILANKDDIILNIDSLYQQVVLSNAMPPGNITWMEYSERETIKLLYQEILENRNKSSLWQILKEIL
tara:strand:- start:25 stop:1278 length:1254 start_codon:yes stop_codon:yes gene_type:complete